MAADKPNKSPCPQCGNLLRLGGLKTGEQVRCPKCGASITVGGESPKRSPQPVGDDASGLPSGEDLYGMEGVIPDRGAPIPPPPLEEFEEDDAYLPEIPLSRSIIGENLPPRTGPLRGSQEHLREVDWSAAEEVHMEPYIQAPRALDEDPYTQSARRRGLVRHFYTPDPPRWTFLSGVFGYPWRGMNIGRWAAMSLSLSGTIFMIVKTLEMLNWLDRSLTDTSIPAIFVGVLAIVMSIIAGSFAFSSCQAAIQDTADGHELPQDSTLPDWDTWVITLLGWIMMAASAAALGYPLSLLIGPQAMLLAFVIFFPILLLSAMEADSFVVPISGPVLRSLGYFLHGWLAFYFLSTLLGMATLLLLTQAYRHVAVVALVISGPVIATFLLIYSRLLGRLAWKASGAPMAPVELDGEAPSEPPQVNAPPRDEQSQLVPPPLPQRSPRKGREIVVPDESVAREPNGGAPPRIKFHRS